MKKNINKVLYWTPRIVAIIFIIFLAMFSLDVFEGSNGFWQAILGLFMHNIPVFILLAVVIISWKREIVGGIAFVLAGIAYIIFTAIRFPFPQNLISSLIIGGPAFLVGILFLVGWFKKKNN